MMDSALNWVGVGAGALVVLFALVWGKRTRKYDAQVHAQPEIEPTEASLLTKTPIQESIRQIALIEKDEFESFYQPVIDRVQEYEQILTGERIDNAYFETVYKALRKRRSAIFEYGSSEKDQQKKALWTFALFSTISVRYIVNRLHGFNFLLNGEELNPMLVDTSNLAKFNLTERENENNYQVDLSNLHLIEKVIDSSAIQRFNQAGIYPFVINAITGFYQERVNPFYTIIEQVESHISNISLDESVVFQQNLKLVLQLIERNTFTKNKPMSLIFEGMYYLLIDRNFLWELFRMYTVSVTQPMGKKEFEVALIKALDLVDFTNGVTVYIVDVDNHQLDDSQEKARLKLLNMLALPYKKVSYYRYTDRRRIEKKTLQRDIVIDDAGRGIAEGYEVVDPAQKIRQREGARVPNTPSNKVGVDDLFSDQQ